MLRKCLFISTALLLCFAVNAQARVYWTDAGTDSLWSNADNWGDYTDPDPCIPGHEGTLAALGREPNASDGTIFIGQGNGLDSGANYPPQLYAFAASGDMDDPTIDTNATTDIGAGYWGGAFSTATYTDPNLDHQLWITAAGKIRVGELKCPIGTGGSMSFYNSGDLNLGTHIHLSRSGGSQGYYYGEPGSCLMVNVEILCPPQNNTGQMGRIYLDDAIANCKRLDWGAAYDSDGTADISNGGKLIVRQKSNTDEGWENAPDWIAEGKITGHGGYVHGELMAGDPLVRCMILTEEVNCPADSNYAGNHAIYTLSGDGAEDLEITSGTQDAYLAYDPDPLDGAGTTGTPLSALNGLNWLQGYDLAAVDSQLFYYDANDGNGLVLKATLGPDVNNIDPYALGYGVSGMNSYWRVDEVNSVGGTTVGDVWSFRADAGPAMNLDPADASGDVYPAQTLSWEAGFLSTASKVYLGTDWDDVNDRIAPNSVEATTYATGDLALDTTYYWCVDALGGGVVPGDVISFTTASTILVDDFDGYADDVALRAVWSDGTYGDNMSTVSVDSTTAIDGNSMMLQYYCYGTYGETSAAMSYRLDAYSISAWVYGSSINASADVYVGCDDGSTVDVEVQAGVDVTVEDWQECRVAFQDLSVVSANIQSVIIGVGTRAAPASEGEGAICIDEVRLYPRRCLAADVIEADFDADCLVQYDDVDMLAQRWLITKTTPIAPAVSPTLYLPFDEGDGNTVAHDASGNGYDFAVIGPILWEPAGGVLGGAVHSDGGNAKLALADDWQTGGTSDQVKQMFAPAVANNNQITMMWYMKWEVGVTAVRNFIFQTEMWDVLSDSMKANPLTFRDRSGGGGFAVWMGIGPDPATGDLPNYGWEFIFDPTYRDMLINSNYDVDPSIKGIWYHYAMVKDTDNGTGRIYEDGVQIVEFDDDYRADVNAVRMPIENICKMGILNGSSAGWSSSRHISLDEFKIYPDALSESEIKFILGDLDPFFPNSGEPMNLFNTDDIINFKDYAEVADVWLDDKLWPDELP